MKQYLIITLFLLSITSSFLGGYFVGLNQNKTTTNDVSIFQNNTSHKRDEVRQAPIEGWILLPDNFIEYQKESGKRANWSYSSIPILNGKYKVGVGPYKFTEPDDGVYDYYSIDIEEPKGKTSYVISQKRFALNYVSESIISTKAKDIVSFNENTKVVTFDLGKSVFKYKLLTKQ